MSEGLHNRRKKRVTESIHNERKNRFSSKNKHLCTPTNAHTACRRLSTRLSAPPPPPHPLNHSITRSLTHSPLSLTHHHSHTKSAVTKLDESGGADSLAHFDHSFTGQTLHLTTHSLDDDFRTRQTRKGRKCPQSEYCRIVVLAYYRILSGCDQLDYLFDHCIDHCLDHWIATPSKLTHHAAHTPSHSHTHAAASFSFSGGIKMLAFLYDPLRCE